jgi:hypothetical protein
MELKSQLVALLGFVIGLVGGAWPSSRQSTNPSIFQTTQSSSSSTNQGEKSEIKRATSTNPSSTSLQGVKTLSSPSSLADIKRLLDLDLLTNFTVFEHQFPDVLNRLPPELVGDAVKLFWSQRDKPYIIFIRELFLKWIKYDPRGVQQWMEQHPGATGERMRLHHVLLSVLADAEPEMALDYVTAHPDEDYEDWLLANTLPAALARKDTEKALAYLARIDDVGLRDAATRTLARAWAREDSTAAWKWVSSLPDSAVTRDARRNVLKSFDLQNAEMLLRDTSARLSIDERSLLLRRLADQPSEPLRNQLLSGQLRLSTQTEAAAAAELIQSYSQASSLLQTLPPGAPRDAFLSNAAINLADDKDWTGSLKLIESIQPSIEKWDAIERYSQVRTRKTPNEVLPWLLTLPPGMERDFAVMGFADMTSGNNPLLAAEWLSSLSDPVFRMDELTPLWRRWQKNEPAAAEAWLNGATKLSATDKARLRKPQSP